MITSYYFESGNDCVMRFIQEEETTKLMKEMERIVEEKSSKVEENLKFLAGNLDGLSIEELKSLELEIREIHQNIQKTIDKKEAEERLCVICMENPKMMAFSTCGHRYKMKIAKSNG